MPGKELEQSILIPSTNKPPEKGLAKIDQASGLETVLSAFKIEEIQIETVQKYLCPQASKDEIALFLYTCRALNLNPFLKQIYLVKYGTAPAQMTISFKEFLKKAWGFPQYRGFVCEEILEGVKLLGAKCTIYFKDGRQPFPFVAWFDEHTKKQSTWLSMPRYMIKKVAIKLAHEQCFPEHYSELGNFEIADDKEIKALQDSTPRSVAEVKPDDSFYGPPAESKLENPPEPELPAKSELKTEAILTLTKEKFPEDGMKRLSTYIRKNYPEALTGAKEMDDVVENLEVNQRQTVVMAIKAGQL